MLYDRSWPRIAPPYAVPMDARSALGDGRLVERRPNALGKLQRIVVRPKMHEEDTRLFGQHVTVERCHLDAVRSQRLDHGVDLIAGDDKVAGNSCLTSASRLEVDRIRRAHRGWHRHPALRNRIAPRHVELVN